MARIIITVRQRTRRGDCRCDVRLDESAHDRVAERNLLREIYEALKAKWTIGDVEDRTLAGEIGIGKCD